MELSLASGAKRERKRSSLQLADADSKLGGQDKPTLLIVEDDIIVASDLEQELRMAGYDVVGVAMTSHEAIRLARDKRPAIAIVDIRLAEGTDGVEAAIQLYRELNIRSIFATAHSDDATQKRAEPSFPLGWVAKPYSAATVVEMLKQTRQ
jgi:DNA-binding NarL/FixJ family response regulator